MRVRSSPASFSILLAACAAWCVGCGRAESTATVIATEDSWTTLVPTKVQARVGTSPNGKIDYALPDPMGPPNSDRVVATAPLAEKTRTPIVIEGHPCEIEQRRLWESSETSVAPGQKHTRSKELRTRTFKNVTFDLRCFDGPVPGTAASEHGSNAKRAYPPAFAGLLFGLATGALAERDRVFSALGVALVAALAAVLLGWLGYGGAFGVTIGLAFAGYAVIGAVAATSSVRMHTSGPAWIFSLAAIAGAVPVLFAYGSWQFGGPLVAFAASVIATVIAAVVWTLLPSRSAPLRA